MCPLAERLTILTHELKAAAFDASFSVSIGDNRQALKQLEKVVEHHTRILRLIKWANDAQERQASFDRMQHRINAVKGAADGSV